MDANTATFYDITGDMKRPMLMQLSPFVLALTQRVLDVQALFVECTSALLTDAQLTVIVKHWPKAA
eukprot:10820-Heterococcus_DN1.PRE.7